MSMSPQSVLTAELKRLKYVDAGAALRIEQALRAILPVPQSSFLFPEGNGDHSQQKSKVLAALKAARSKGCSNQELNEICFRYGARIYELRHEDGLRITSFREKGGLWRFRLDPTDW